VKRKTLKGHKALMDETSPFPKVLLADRGYGANLFTPMWRIAAAC
jgi:hypothetical protein